MKTTVFLASCAIAFAGHANALVQVESQPAAMSFVGFQAAGELAGRVVPAIDGTVGAPWMQLARNGADDAGGDDNSGHGGGDDGDDHDGDDDDDSDEDGSGSGRKSPRVPGGSGCDDAGDALEHAECNG